jgi:predicted ATP-grasp superfamily ATP-dependent carboligase
MTEAEYKPAMMAMENWLKSQDIPDDHALVIINMLAVRILKRNIPLDNLMHEASRYQKLMMLEILRTI